MLLKCLYFKISIFIKLKNKDAMTQKMLAGIVAFELEVTGLQCKVKLNQHRPEARSAMRAIYAAGGENEQALAVWMDSLNADAAQPSRQAG